MFALDAVVPWGRSFDEYRRMFAMSEADVHSRILGCADGPASFNAEATRRGLRVISCDPLCISATPGRFARASTRPSTPRRTDSAERGRVRLGRRDKVGRRSGARPEGGHGDEF
jgi:hypothetical protein